MHSSFSKYTLEVSKQSNVLWQYSEYLVRGHLALVAQLDKDVWTRNLMLVNLHPARSNPRESKSASLLAARFGKLALGHLFC